MGITGLCRGIFNLVCLGLVLQEVDQNLRVEFLYQQWEGPSADTALTEIMPNAAWEPRYYRQSATRGQQVMLVKQNPEAIDAGVFHNDVIALSHDGLLLCHERAFMNQAQVLEEIQTRSGQQVHIIEVKESEISLAQAVSSYLFNSQILGPAQHRILLLPGECEQNSIVKQYVETTLREQLNLQEIAYLDLQQSMRNGGGPACLRLRVSLDDAALNAMLLTKSVLIA